MLKNILNSIMMGVFLLLVVSSAAMGASNRSLRLISVSGQGTVYFGSSQVSEGSSISVNKNAQISIKAVPAPGYVFSAWNSNPQITDPSSAETEIDMDGSSQNVSVTFVAQNTVTVTIEGSGSVTLIEDSSICQIQNSGETCSFGDGAIVTLTASPGPDASFVSWEGVDEATGEVATLAVGSSDHAVTATFDLSTIREVRLDFHGSGTGSVALAGSTDYDTTESGIFTFDTAISNSVTLTATADVDMEFGGWSGVSSSSNTVTLILDSDKDIGVTFNDPASAGVIPGCGSSVSLDYTSGFDAADFALTGVSVVGGNTLKLDTGNAALDPNNIIIPFEQEVSVTFLYEGAGYDSNDLGWLYGTEDPATATPRPIYNNINDNNNDGVLDRGFLDDGGSITDNNGDGLVNALDNRVSLGHFAAGTEIVFTLTAGYESTVNPPTFYTKKDWNSDTWNGSCPGDDFTKTYHLGSALGSEGSCSVDSNWMGATALNRLSSLFDLTFTASDTQTLHIVRGEKFDHVIVGTPADKPNEWVLGWEDLGGGGDTDHNDMIFQIERKTGGSAQLLLTEAITPVEADAYFTAVTLAVTDSMPGAGASSIA
ncbi:MAG: DUF4114 domain-containing protein [Desulfuromonadaceae bacterium]